jgi:fructokinase
VTSDAAAGLKAAATVPSTVLVIGESLTDVLRVDGRESRHPGGSPMNVAYGLGRLGVPTRLLTHMGRDSDADEIISRLHTADVDVVEGSQTDGRTGTAVATIDSEGVANYSFEVDWQLRDLTGLRVPRWIHVGSIATFLAPGADTLELFLTTRLGQSRMSYDPNIRPQFLPDHSAAVSRFERFARMADVVKLSDDDASWLYPDLDVDVVLDRILSLGSELAVMTTGSEGALLTTSKDVVTVHPPRVDVVDTVGAGDSFMAALLAQLVTRASLNFDAAELETIGRTACAAAAMTCTRAGSQPPSRVELLAIL